MIMRMHERIGKCVRLHRFVCAHLRASVLMILVHIFIDTLMQTYIYKYVLTHAHTLAGFLPLYILDHWKSISSFVSQQ